MHVLSVKIEGVAYKINENPIGKGAESKVLLGQIQNNRFALKHIQKYSNQQVKMRTDNEILVLMHMRDEQHIAKCISYQIMNNKQVWMVLQLGESLVSKLRTQIFSIERWLTMLIHVAHGLNSLHSRNIFWRDLKPQNIIQVKNVFKLIDFGTVSIADHSNLHPNDFIGTIKYMAPQILLQQISNQAIRVDLKADCWSFGTIILNAGILAFQCFFGVHPFHYTSDQPTPHSLITNIYALIPFSIEAFCFNVKDSYPALANKVAKRANALSQKQAQIFGKLLLFDADKRPNSNEIIDMMDTLLTHQLHSRSKDVVKRVVNNDLIDKQANLFISVLQEVYEMKKYFSFVKQQYFETALQIMINCNKQCIATRNSVLYSRLNSIQLKVRQKIISSLLKQFWNLLLNEDHLNLYHKKNILMTKVLMASCWDKLYVDICKRNLSDLKLFGLSIPDLEVINFWLQSLSDKDHNNLSEYINNKYYF